MEINCSCPPRKLKNVISGESYLNSVNLDLFSLNFCVFYAFLYLNRVFKIPQTYSTTREN